MGGGPSLERQMCVCGGGGGGLSITEAKGGVLGAL